MMKNGERPGPEGSGRFGLYADGASPGADQGQGAEPAPNRERVRKPQGQDSAPRQGRTRDSAAGARANPSGKSRRRGPAPVLMHPANAALLQYWHLTRGEGPIPAWAHIDLMELTAYLPNMMLLEWTKWDQLYCRFAGPRIVSWMGRDPTNVNLKALGGIAHCKALIPSLCADALVLLKVGYQTRSGAQVFLEDLCMPVRSPGRPVSHVIIGSQLLDGRPGEGPGSDTIRPETFRLLGRIRLPLDPIDRGTPLVYALNASRMTEPSSGG
ncbi:MAG: PAS domain-containing protein [Alphaproteobacteria bacterium]